MADDRILGSYARFKGKDYLRTPSSAKNIVLNADETNKRSVWDKIESLNHNYISKAVGISSIPDSDEGFIKNLVIYGLASQAQYEGLNLFQISATAKTSTINGITFTVNGDGTVTANGTATAAATFSVGSFAFSNDTTYRLVGCPVGGSSEKFALLVSNSASTVGVDFSDYGDGCTATTTSAGTCSVVLEVMAGVTVNNIIFKPMITTDTVATYSDFEPYVGGAASPSASYPQTIHVTKGPKVNLVKSDLSESQHTVSLSTITLNAVPVSSGGNVTVDDQQYVSDYILAELGKIVRMVDATKYDESVSIVGNSDLILETPIEEALTDAQKEELKNLYSYCDGTNTSVTSDDYKGVMAFSYPQDIKSYVDSVLGDQVTYTFDSENKILYITTKA